MTRDCARGTPDVALVAVGGYGRAQLSPHSDLDIVLVAADGYDGETLSRLAAALWYPLWDNGVRIDHAVRTESELRAAAADDLRVALGLLDIRCVAGDPTLARGVRTTVLTDWRRAAKRRLPTLADQTRRRWARAGQLVHATTSDLKESQGGLRDVTVLRALLASWLVDVPTAELNRLEAGLLEVRDALHETTGRYGDRLVADYASEVASRLGLGGAESLRSSLVATGRAIAHLSSVALRNIDRLLTPAPPSAPQRPVLEKLAAGVGAHRGEVVLTNGA